MKQVYWLRFSVVLLLILVIVAAGVAYFCFSFSRLFYANENALRLDPLGLSTFPANPTPSSSDLKRVVFLGDSRAESWPPPPDLSGWAFINRGVAGQTTAQVLGRFSAHVTPLRPKVVILQVGINDLRTLPIFPDRRAEIIANCLNNIKAIIKQANDLGAVIILTSIFPVTGPSIERSVFYWSDDVARSAIEANAALRSLVTDRVLMLDADPILLGSDGLARPEYMLDTLHLNTAGYEALNQRLTQLLSDVPE
jgi:lysophospholipase L1-like esterase